MYIVRIDIEILLGTDFAGYGGIYHKSKSDRLDQHLVMYALRPRDMQKSGANVVFVDESVFPQTLAVVTTRASPRKGPLLREL